MDRDTLPSNGTALLRNVSPIRNVLIHLPQKETGWHKHLLCLQYWVTTSCFLLLKWPKCVRHRLLWRQFQQEINEKVVSSCLWLASSDQITSRLASAGVTKPYNNMHSVSVLYKHKPLLLQLEGSHPLFKTKTLLNCTVPTEGIMIGEISGSQDCEYEDSCLLGCCTVKSGRNLPTFQRCLLPSSSGRWWWRQQARLKRL
jgi:hypothetical protein